MSRIAYLVVAGVTVGLLNPAGHNSLRAAQSGIPLEPLTATIAFDLADPSDGTPLSFGLKLVSSITRDSDDYTYVYSVHHDGTRPLRIDWGAVRGLDINGRINGRSEPVRFDTRRKSKKMPEISYQTVSISLRRGADAPDVLIGTALAPTYLTR